MLRQLRPRYGGRALWRCKSHLHFSTSAPNRIRLINVNTLCMKEFFDADTPKYAVLSHTWRSPQDEVSYVDYLSGAKLDTTGYTKITTCAALTRAFDLEWAWVDTCCIDKTSSAELSEAINSMYSWYQNSYVCLALLSDLQTPDHVAVNNAIDLSESNKDPEMLSQLRQCRWFSRGWTLQELLAPSQVVFFDSKLQLVGTRQTLAPHITSITGIDDKYLKGGIAVRKASIAQRMSWLSNRTTTRAEDIAYCMLGLFNINMPLLYGEGSRAFMRLQEHIVTESSDESIFAWNSEFDEPRGLLAEHPREFAKCGNIVVNNYNDDPKTEITSRGIELTRSPKSRSEAVIWSLGIMPVPTVWRRLTYVLACEDAETGRALTITLSLCQPWRMFPLNAARNHRGGIPWYRVRSDSHQYRKKSPHNFMADAAPFYTTKILVAKNTPTPWQFDENTWTLYDQKQRRHLVYDQQGSDSNVDGFVILYAYVILFFGSIFYATKTKHAKDMSLPVLLMPVIGPILGFTHPALPMFYFMLMVELFRRDYLPEKRASRPPPQAKKSGEKDE